jgi:hypothetical protein
VADRNDSIDLRTLEEVRRLLATTDFATIDDLARRSGEPTQLADALDRVQSGATPSAASADSTGFTPLPRRR